MFTIGPISTDTTAACACGDDFHLLLAPHLAALHRLARSIVLSDDLACDVVQETLLTLWMRQDQPPDLRGWLVRTVVHKSLHVLRREDRRGRHEERAGLERHETCPLCAPPEPLEPAEEAAELRARLDSAIAELSAELRTTFLLRVEDGLAYQAIAETLSIPIGTVRSRLKRARESLAAQLA